MKIENTFIAISVEDLRRILDGLEDTDSLLLTGNIEVYKLEQEEYNYYGYINLAQKRFVKE